MKNAMKWIVFAVLKVVEIGAIVFVPYYVGLWNPVGFEEYIPTWWVGLFTILPFLCGLFLAVCIGSGFFRLNKELAERIVDRWKS